MKEMKAYWGGMLKEGATSFWEKYNPEETGTQHLAMYTVLMERVCAMPGERVPSTCWANIIWE